MSYPDIVERVWQARDQALFITLQVFDDIQVELSKRPVDCQFCFNLMGVFQKVFEYIFIPGLFAGYSFYDDPSG